MAKILSRDILHKTEAGGGVLGVGDGQAMAAFSMVAVVESDVSEAGINPRIVGAEGKGVTALDGLIVLS